jgi:Ca2+-binding EF-hand superfamily protein
MHERAPDSSAAAVRQELDSVRHVELKLSLSRGNAMKNPHLKVLVPIAIASIAWGIALAGGDKQGQHSMHMMDKDGDGKITSAEHATGAQEMFAKMDANQDGRVTATEMDAARTAKMDAKATKPDQDKMQGDRAKAHHMSSAEKIAKLDSNGDGQLTAQEHAAGAEKMFGKMDKDGNGTLTAKELDEGHRSMMTAHDD